MSSIHSDIGCERSEGVKTQEGKNTYQSSLIPLKLRPDALFANSPN